MFRIAAACLAAIVLCSACLTKEDLDCWYDDMCMKLDGDAPAKPVPLHSTQPERTGR